VLFVIIRRHLSRHCGRSEAIQNSLRESMDCFGAALLAMTDYFFTNGQRDSSIDWNASLLEMVASSL
jgi:hypothetical protein